MEENKIPETIDGGSAEEPMLELIAEGMASTGQEPDFENDVPMPEDEQPQAAEAFADAAAMLDPAAPEAAPEAVPEAAPVQEAPAKEKKRGMLNNVFGYELTLIKRDKPSSKSKKNTGGGEAESAQKEAKRAPSKPKKDKASKEEKAKLANEKKAALATERAAKKAEKAKLAKEKKDAKPKPKPKAKPVKKAAAAKNGKEKGKGVSKKLIFAIVGVIAVSGGAAAAFMLSSTTNKPEALLLKAEQYAADENYEKSMETYDKIIDTGELLPEAYLGIADLLVSGDDTAAAIEKLTAGFEETGDERLSQRIEELTPSPDPENSGPVVSSEPIVWQDRALERMIRLALDIGDGPITEQDLERVTCLKILGNTHASIDEAALHSKNGIDSYTIGDETFSERGEISRLDDISHFKSLNRLIIGYNNISDISGLKGMSFSTLSLYANEIEDISPLEDMKGLRFLYLYNNSIKDISPLKGNTELISLSLQHNEIRDISPLSSLLKLQELYISSNQVEDISPLEGLENLAFLNAQENSILDIKAVARLPALTDASFLGNPVLDYSPAAHIQNLNKSFGSARG